MSMPIFPILITATVHHTITFSQNVDAVTQGVPGQSVQYLMILRPPMGIKIRISMPNVDPQW